MLNVVMLSIDMLNIDMLNVVMLSVVMLSVVAPNITAGVYLNNVLRLSYDQITTWAQYNKTFYSRNSRFFVIS
jgi:hypothetical protein